MRIHTSCFSWAFLADSYLARTGYTSLIIVFSKSALSSGSAEKQNQYSQNTRARQTSVPTKQQKLYIHGCQGNIIPVCNVQVHPKADQPMLGYRYKNWETCILRNSGPYYWRNVTTKYLFPPPQLTLKNLRHCSGYHIDKELVSGMFWDSQIFSQLGPYAD